MGEGNKSLAIRLEFQAPDRTLTDDEVAGLRALIEDRIAELGGSPRCNKQCSDLGLLHGGEPPSSAIRSSISARIAGDLVVGQRAVGRLELQSDRQ